MGHIDPVAETGGIDNGKGNEQPQSLIEKLPADGTLDFLDRHNTQMRLTVRRILSIFVFKNFIDIVSSRAYNNSTRQATACVCQSVEIRECAGTHCLMELSGGVVQRYLKPA